MKLGLWNLIVSFVVSILIAPIIIRWLRKLKFGQSILVYVEQHKTKSGTATMGGIIFILSTIITAMFFIKKDNMLSIICLLGFLAFGVLGFLDDFIKIKFKQNEGLKPYQKIIGQLGISIIFAIYIYNSSMIGGEIAIPFTDITVNIGGWIIPFVIFYFVAVVNSVNLIDGLDGLCSGVSSVFLLSFSIILAILSAGYSGVYFNQVNNIIIVLLGAVGAIVGFMCFNGYPAKIFMGDTGSLAIGGLIAVSTALTRQYLLMCIIGMLYVLTAVSVIIQVVVFKLTNGKRVFKMSPLHHHFEVKHHESKITTVYTIVTMIIAVIAIAIYL